MIGRIVEIASDGRYLSVYRGFLLVSHKGEEEGRVALDDIAAVIANAYGLTYSNNLLVSLAERNIVFVFCSSNHSPAGFLWSISGHYQQSGRMDSQIAATNPTRKRLWQQVVRSKLQNQAMVLESLGQPSGAIAGLIRRVKSGDPENIEAVAARRYWPSLFGKNFHRDRAEPGINSLLNYGYTILRAGVARAVLAGGLHPSLGLHHQNTSNPMRLVDDLMEPFRPFVDLTVHGLALREVDAVTKEAKRILASALYRDLSTSRGSTPLSTCLHYLVKSLVDIYDGISTKLDFPNSPSLSVLKSFHDAPLEKRC